MRLYGVVFVLVLAVGCAAQPEVPAPQATAYVPLDHWAYRLFDRLAGLGRTRTALLGMRPWTRVECARLILEAEDLLGEEDDAAARAALRTLRAEIEGELHAIAEGPPAAQAGVESVYVRLGCALIRRSTTATILAAR